MDLAVPPTRTLRWWVLVYAALITPISVDQIGLVNDAGPDLIKWALRIPVWFLPLAILVPRWGTLLEAVQRPPMSWLLAWACFGVTSVAWAFVPTQAVIMSLSIAGLIVLTTWYVSTSGWENFARAMVVGLTAFLMLGMLLDFAQSTLIPDRSIGLATGPTAQGRIAAFNLVLAAGVIWSRRSSLLFLAAPMVSVAALIFSETRTAMAAAAVGLLYGGLRRFSPLDRSLAVAGLGVGLTSAFGLAVAFTDIAAFGERGDPTSVAGRTSIWPVAWDFITDRPILGWGWGASGELFSQAARTGSIAFEAGTTHSVPLALLVQGGLIGFLLFSIALVSAFRHRRRVDPWLMALIVTLLFSGLTEAIIHIPSVAIMLVAAVLAAISGAPARPVAGSATSANRAGATGRPSMSVGPSGQATGATAG